MSGQIQNFEINLFEFPRDRTIGDSQVKTSLNSLAALELFDSDGRSGLGFFYGALGPLPNHTYLKELFRDEYMPRLKGELPESLLHAVRRPRGGNFELPPYYLFQAIDQALWDLASKRAELPLYRYLGGANPTVPIYGSGLCYHLSEDELHKFYVAATQYKFNAYKVKVGHPDLAWDIRRLEIVRDAVGPTPLLMVDANEAWSPKEAIRRIRAFEEAGYPIYWVEDPIIRHDTQGLKEIKAALPDTYLNAGEYLFLNGKSKLVENNAADVINIHGDISAALKIGWLCSEHGIPVSLGNTPMELGAHISSALPEVLHTEYSMHNADIILKKKFDISDGAIHLPNVPGHGLELSSTASRDFRKGNT